LPTSCLAIYEQKSYEHWHQCGPNVTRSPLLIDNGLKSESYDPARYDQAVAEYAGWVQRAQTYSMHTHAVQTPSEKVYLGSILFIGVVLRARSLLRLLPGSSLHSRDSESTLDFGSIASIARSLMEACYVFYGLAIEDVPNAEWQARVLVARLHEAVERRTMLRKLGDGGSQHDREVTDFIENLRTELSDNTHIGTLEEADQQKCFQGGMPFLGSIQEISTHYLGDREYARFLYKWLSNYSHQQPFAFFSTSMDRGRGIENAEEGNLTVLLLEQCNEHLIVCCQQYLDLFPHLDGLIEKKIANAIDTNKHGHRTEVD